MTATLGLDEWIEVLDREYLGSFVADGGASVKFAVGVTGTHLSERLNRAAGDRDLLVVAADAAAVKVHMVDQLFFCLAGQVPWGDLARAKLFALATGEGYQAEPTVAGPVNLIVAEANDLDPVFVLGELRRRVTQTVFKDASLMKDFRVAMTQLCLAELTGGPEGATTSRVIIEWLTGTNRAVAAVKPYAVRTRIMRTNARMCIESLLAWVRSAGRGGTVIVVDVRRLAVARNPRDDQVFYAKAALLDAYEVLRSSLTPPTASRAA